MKTLIKGGSKPNFKPLNIKPIGIKPVVDWNLIGGHGLPKPVLPDLKPVGTTGGVKPITTSITSSILSNVDFSSTTSITNGLVNNTGGIVGSLIGGPIGGAIGSQLTAIGSALGIGNQGASAETYAQLANHVSEKAAELVETVANDPQGVINELSEMFAYAKGMYDLHLVGANKTLPRIKPAADKVAMASKIVKEIESKLDPYFLITKQKVTETVTMRTDLRQYHPKSNKALKITYYKYSLAQKQSPNGASEPNVYGDFDPRKAQTNNSSSSTLLIAAAVVLFWKPIKKFLKI